MTTKSIASIPSCWVYKDHTYTYTKKGHEVKLLPSVFAEYKPVLEALGVPHRPINSGLKYEFWDSNCYVEKEESFPLYLYNAGQYRYIKNYNASIASDEMQAAAFALEKAVVEPEINRLRKEKEKSDLVFRLKSALNGRPACGISRYDETILQTIPDSGIDLVLEDTHIRVFRVYTLMSEARKARLINQYWDYCGVEPEFSNERCQRVTKYLAVFDMNKCKTGSPITLEVPSGTEGIFIGRQGWQLKEWCNQLGGIPKINVVADKFTCR